ncbi:hypothetical protein ACVWWO_007881 [Bradyrhizobium sp. F1.13.1]
MIDRHRAGETDDGGLRCRVAREPARPQRRDRRDVDDRAAPRGLDHRRDRVLGEQEHALDIDLHDAAILLGRFVHHAAAAADAHIVVEEIEPAPMVKRGFDQRPAIALAGDVTAMRRGRAAFGCDHLDGSFSELELAIGHQNFGAGAGQQNCGRAAVANAVARSAAAADQRHLAGETGIVLEPLHVVHPEYFRAL